MWMSDVCACTCNIICIDKHHWTQISISYLPQKNMISRHTNIYYIILSIHLTGLYFIKMCVYNIQYMVAALQVRCMTIIHKVADQDSVLLTIAYSNLRPMAPLVNARLSTPWFLNLMHLKQLQKHICPLRFARISHKSLNQHYHFQFALGGGHDHTCKNRGEQVQFRSCWTCVRKSLTVLAEGVVNRKLRPLRRCTFKVNAI